MNPAASSNSIIFKAIIMMAGLVVVVAGLMQAKVVLIPLMMAILVVVVTRGPIDWLRRKGTPDWLAHLLVLVLFCSAILLVVMVVGSSMADFVQNVPKYQASLQQQTERLETVLAGKGIHLQGSRLHEMLNPGSVMSYVGKLFSDLSGVFANGFLVLLLVVFISLEASGFPAKLKMIFGAHNDRVVLLINEFNASVRSYMAIKTIVSLLTGGLVALSLFVIGVDYPIMWGMLAFAFNFIPNIGSIIAAVPAVLLSLVQLGVGNTLAVAACYLAINVLVGNVIEPRFMGKGLGLSTTVVFLSLVFWGWVFGPVGMLLSVVLTMNFKLVLACSEETRWLALLLGPNPEE
jgi:AI-2 transport protein TqsA